MEFRDFSSFNNSLVAKQSWRLLQYLESLVAKVLQARYYKASNFLRAKLGHKPSFIWRSIVWGNQVIQKEIRWRVGDREKIIVHNERWIPRPTTFKLLSTPTLDNDATVSNLIHRDNRWTTELVKQYFMEGDTDLILNIPLPKTPHKDSILWHFDKRVPVL